MPDWLIHMGSTHALGRPFRRWDLRWLFLGAVLPDVVARVAGSAIGAIPLLEPLRTPPVHLYLAFLHTPVSVLLLLGAVLVFAADRREAALALSFGAVLHFALDLLQKSFGGGLSLLYPLDLRPFSLHLGWYENPLTYTLVAVFGVYLVVLAWRRPAGPAARALRGWSAGRGLLAAALLAACFALPLSCLERAREVNLGASRLAEHPEAYEGQEVQLPVASVEELDGDWVHLEIMDTVFLVGRARLPDVRVGDHVSVRGIYSRGRIEPIAVFVHTYGFKKIVSLLGMLLLLVFWVPRFRLRAGRAAARAA